MTARFLLNLREWDYRMSNPDLETDQCEIHAGGEDGQPSPMQFEKSEPRTATQWTINDVLGDDPLLKSVKFEVNPQGGLSSGSDASVKSVFDTPQLAGLQYAGVWAAQFCGGLLII